MDERVVDIGWALMDRNGKVVVRGSPRQYRLEWVMNHRGRLNTYTSEAQAMATANRLKLGYDRSIGQYMEREYGERWWMNNKWAKAVPIETRRI